MANDNIKEYEALKISYAESELNAYNWHKNRMEYWLDQKLNIDTWAAQGFSHGRSYKEEHVPQNHYRGDKTEAMIIDYGEKVDYLEERISEEKAHVDRIDKWLDDLPVSSRGLIKDYYFKHKSRDLMAEVRGVTKNTIKAHIEKILLSFPTK